MVKKIYTMIALEDIEAGSPVYTREKRVSDYLRLIAQFRFRELWRMFRADSVLCLATASGSDQKIVGLFTSQSDMQFDGVIDSIPVVNSRFNPDDDMKSDYGYVFKLPDDPDADWSMKLMPPWGTIEPPDGSDPVDN